MDEEFSKFLEEVKDEPVKEVTEKPVEEVTLGTCDSTNKEPPENEQANEPIANNPIESDKSTNIEDKKFSEDTKTAESSSSESLKDSPEDPTKHTRYEGTECIYTNPETKEEYTWSTDMKMWVPRGYKPEFDGTSYKFTDSKGITYKWVSDKNKWENIEDQKEENSKQPQYGFDGENHTYTDPKDNTEYIWDKEKNAWFPNVNEDFMAKYQLSYGFVDNTTSEEKEVEPEKKAEKRKPSTPAWFELDDQHNTKVYVSNLPSELTEQEFVDFMQKCGLILKDIKTNKYKVKLYKEPDGTFKGDALCDYIKIESVDLALKVLDGADFKGKRVKIERAKFQMRGDFNPALKPKKRKKREIEKEKKLQQKLLDWRPDKLRGEREKHERTVVLKNLFDPSLFNDNVELILEFSEDVKTEASKCGQVRKVKIYDRNPDGVATINFADAEEADVCVKFLNNRWFGKRQITAETWDGKTKYIVTENKTEVTERLEKWNKFLEN